MANIWQGGFIFDYIPCPTRFAITSGHTRETFFLCCYTTSQKNKKHWSVITWRYCQRLLKNCRWTSAPHCLTPFSINLLLSSNCMKFESPQNTSVLYPSKIKHQLHPLENWKLIKDSFFNRSYFRKEKNPLNKLHERCWLTEAMRLLATESETLMVKKKENKLNIHILSQFLKYMFLSLLWSTWLNSPKPFYLSLIAKVCYQCRACSWYCISSNLFLYLQK